MHEGGGSRVGSNKLVELKKKKKNKGTGRKKLKFQRDKYVLFSGPLYVLSGLPR